MLSFGVSARGEHRAQLVVTAVEEIDTTSPPGESKHIHTLHEQELSFSFMYDLEFDLDICTSKLRLLERCLPRRLLI